MKRKAIISILVCIILTFSFACSKDDDSPTLDVDNPKFSSSKNDDSTNNAGGSSNSEGSTNSTKKSQSSTTAAKVDTTSVAKDGSVTISWDAVKGASSYDVYRASSKDGDYKKVGTSATTSYTDKTAEKGKTYYYKISANVPTTASNNTAAGSGSGSGSKTTESNSPKFVGSKLSFKNNSDKTVTISSYLNDAYTSKIISEYKNIGYTFPSGRLVHVTVEGVNFEYVYQFSSPTKWNDGTLEQVHIFTAGSTSSYESFFVTENGSKEYLAAKEAYKQKWDSNSNRKISYDKQRELFLEMAKYAQFQTLCNQSYK